MITSTSNQQIKNIIKLQKSKKARDEQGVYLVEGIRMFREIPADELVKVYATEDCAHRYITRDVEAGKADSFTHISLQAGKEETLTHIIRQEGRNYEVVSDSVFKEITDTQTPQGILAVVRQKQYTREDLLGKRLCLQDGENSPKTVPCILLLENLQDPGNLGTILRTAEGAGVTGIMMSKDTVDIYNSKVVRSTMGAIFRMPFCYESDVYAGVDWLKTQGICCYAAHLNGSSFYEQNYQKPTCFFIGNEGNGLTKELTEQADTNIRIPMMGAVESLNAATAATVLMYEAMRQRMQ